MAAVEGSLGFLPRRILVDAREEGGRAASLPKRAWEKNCAMAEPSPGRERSRPRTALTEDRWLGGRLPLVQPKRGHRVGTDAALLVAAAGDARPGPDRRRRRGGRRGRARAGEARARSSRSILSRSIPSWRSSPRATRRATGFRRARGSCGSTRSTRARAARRGSAEFGRLRRHQPAVLRRQDGPRLSRRGQSARACHARRRRRDACRLDSGLARDARARRAVS